MGYAAHEMRDTLNTAIPGFHMLKRGAVAINGSTGAVLGRSLMTLRDLIDRTLSEVRLEAAKHYRERVWVVDFIDETAATGLLHSEYRLIDFTVREVNPMLAVDADPQLLASAVMNLLHNAFKHTAPGGHVELRAHEAGGRLLIEVADTCGGIPEAKGDLFQSFGDRRAATVLASVLACRLRARRCGPTAATSAFRTRRARAVSSSSTCRWPAPLNP